MAELSSVYCARRRDSASRRPSIALGLYLQRSCLRHAVDICEAWIRPAPTQALESSEAAERHQKMRRLICTLLVALLAGTGKALAVTGKVHWAASWWLLSSQQ